jgi:hypothetical protein
MNTRDIRLKNLLSLYSATGFALGVVIGMFACVGLVALIYRVNLLGFYLTTYVIAVLMSAWVFLVYRKTMRTLL